MKYQILRRQDICEEMFLTENLKHRRDNGDTSDTEELKRGSC